MGKDFFAFFMDVVTQMNFSSVHSADVQLPIKKSNQGADTSSSDDDTSDDDRCYENEAVIELISCFFQRLDIPYPNTDIAV